MSPGPEKRSEAEAESGTGEAVIQGNAWSLKTIVLRIVECLLLIPVFLAAIWLWKGSGTLPYLTGDGIWLTVGAVAAEGIGCVLVIGNGIVTQRKKQESENHRHKKRDQTLCQMKKQGEKQQERQQERQGGKQGERQQQRQRKKQQERQREKPSWEMIFAEEDGEREIPENATDHYLESAYKSDVNEKSELNEKSESGRSQNESDDCHTVWICFRFSDFISFFRFRIACIHCNCIFLTDSVFNCNRNISWSCFYVVLFNTGIADIDRNHNRIRLQIYNLG